MMLARFGAAGLLTDQQSTCCLVTPQRAIINIASAGSVLHKKPAQVQFMRDTLFDDAGRFGAAGLHRPAVNMLSRL
jgi:hypothetical protein